MFASCKKDDPPKTITVAAQVGTMTAGETQTVTFAVTTENIADGSYTPQVAKLPTGVTAQGKVDISNNKGTLTLSGSANTQAGTPNDLTLTIDGATSKAFTLTITAATFGISVAPPTLDFGTLGTSYTQPAAQTVTITNNKTGTVTLNALPAVTNYTLGALSKNTLGAGETATFTVQPNANLAAGTYPTTINISGSNGASASVNATFEVKGAPVITTPAGVLLPHGIMGTPYNVTLEATNNPTNWTLIDITLIGLPDGLTFNTSTGVISGTPNQITDAWSFGVTASNEYGTSEQVNFTIGIRYDAAPGIQTAT
jgi:uncharacterized membrane protein